MLKAPFYIVSDNHFFMKNNQDEQKRRKKMFDVFNQIVLTCTQCERTKCTKKLG